MSDTIESFFAAQTAERLRMVQDPVHAPLLKAALGADAFDELQQLATAQHLGITHPTNLIFVPGVTGSLLQSKTKGGIWWIDVRTRQHIDDLRLSADGSRDADPNNAIVACAVDTSYEPFLTAVLGRDDFGHEVFPYDWRKPLKLSTAALKKLIVESYETNGHQPVHLVGHSMGGLVIRAALMAHGDELWSLLGNIVFVGTPHYGSPAMGGYLKNHFWGFELMFVLGLYLGRAAFRSMWGALSLLPAPKGVYPGTRPGDRQPWTGGKPGDPYVHPCANFDLYDAGAWSLELSAGEAHELQAVLDGGQAFHRELYAHHQSLDQSLRDRMLVIAGVGYKTLFRLAYEKHLLGLWESMEKTTARIPGDRHREGDGRVPLASAELEHVQMRYAKGVHGGLTNLPAVYDDVFRWLNGQTLQLPDTPEGALAQHLAAGMESSAAPHLDGTAGLQPFSDDPGLWNVAPPDPAAIEQLKAKAEAADLPEFHRIHLL